jgi:hypothetical protein
LHDRHFSAVASFQIGRIARTPDRIKWDARAGLTVVAFNFKPAVSTVQALPDRRGRLAGPP